VWGGTVPRIREFRGMHKRLHVAWPVSGQAVIFFSSMDGHSKRGRACWRQFCAPFPLFFISVASKGFRVYVSGLESTLVGISLSVDSKGTYVAPKWGAPARELLWGEGQLRPFAPQTHPERKRGASLRLSRNDAFDLRSHTLTVALSEMTLAGGLA